MTFRGHLVLVTAIWAMLLSAWIYVVFYYQPFRDLIACDDQSRQEQEVDQ